jgi:hypothetical protein
MRGEAGPAAPVPRLFASSRASSVVLTFALTAWAALGGSSQLSPAR